MDSEKKLKTYYNLYPCVGIIYIWYKIMYC